MTVEKFSQKLMKAVIVFQMILTMSYVCAFGLKTGAISLLLLTMLVMLYLNEVYEDLTSSYMIFNIYSVVSMFYSLYIFGMGYGFEFYLWYILGAALFVPFIKNWKIRLTICMACIVMWEIVSYMEFEPIEPDVPRWAQIFVMIYNDVYSFGLIFSFAYVNEHYLRKGEEGIRAAAYDSLTALLNRRGLEEKLKEYKDRPAAIAICDIDDFKSINDTYGHDIGDIVLKKVSKAFLRFAGRDLIIRWGGEEILIYMNSASVEVAERKLNQILSYVREITFFENELDLKVSFTAGVTEINSPAEFEDGVRKADELLYQGKKNGKNQVVTEKNQQ